MKKLLLLSALLCFTVCSARAQLSSTITSQLHDPTFSMGRDCWLAVPSNDWGVNSGKYIDLYITSTASTIAYVEAGGVTTKVSVTAYNTSTFTVPVSLEMESSGIAENKGIHIYSNDADLEVYFLSYDNNSSDGTYIIPTIGWGEDYVVASYGSLFEGGGTYAYDAPSELTVVASEDNTVIEITPSCNCRKSMTGNDSGNAQSRVVAFPAEEPFSVTLNRGQSMQLMPVLAEDPDNYDLTGTFIHANNPVGVIGGSMLSNIPADYAYSNFLCEMIPPVRTWGETYYSTYLEQPPGQPSHDAERYLFISTVPNQIIYRTVCPNDQSIECQFTNQYGIYWDEVSGAAKFWSNAPFLAVAYSNSSTYPDGINGDGSPSESAINPREQFTNVVVFETPSGTSFTNYANIICNINAAQSAFFDGRGVVGLPAQCIDDTFEMFTLEKIAPGVHRVGSDSGVDVSIYGYGFSAFYASSTPSGVATFHSPDTIPPLATTMTECYQSFIHVSDSGLLPNPADTQSGLDAIWIDSSHNMIFQPDADWIEGSGADTSGYTATVIDPTKPGIVTVQVYDLAGNLTTVTTTYIPNYALIVPAEQNLGVWINGAPNIAYDTIYNKGTLPFDITELQLLKGDVGFTLHDSIGGPLDLSPLAPNERRVIQIEFAAVEPTYVVDSIIFDGQCNSMSVAVIGSGGANDFLVTSQTWVNEPYDGTPASYTKTVEIENLSTKPITIDKGTWPDAHFMAVTAFPLIVPAAPGRVAFQINYTPDANSLTPFSDRTQGTWTSPNVLATDGTESPRFDSLIGNAVTPLAVNEDNSTTDATILPTNDGRSIEIILPTNINGSVTFELVNVLGESVLHETFSTGTQNVDASSLPRGVYFYRLTSGQMNQSGKVILGE